MNDSKDKLFITATATNIFGIMLIILANALGGGFIIFGLFGLFFIIGGTALQVRLYSRK